MAFSQYNTIFGLGDGIFAAIGTLLVRVPCLVHSFIAILIDVNAMDIHMLLGLFVLYRGKLVANNVANVLLSNNFR